LRDVYTFYAYSEDSIIPPDQMRRTMAVVGARERTFALGEMEDASEVLAAIFRALHAEAAACGVVRDDAAVRVVQIRTRLQAEELHTRAGNELLAVGIARLEAIGRQLHGGEALRLLIQDRLFFLVRGDPLYDIAVRHGSRHRCPAFLRRELHASIRGDPLYDKAIAGRRAAARAEAKNSIAAEHQLDAL
jgi:hypothetical protein